MRARASGLAALGIDPPVILAPMAGITDLPFRRIVGRFGAGLVVSEMVASQDMVRGRPGTVERAALGLDEAVTAVQIAGREAHWMAEAARRIAGAGARRIDINMGCPAKKVTNGLSGAALMRDPDHALSLIEAVVAAVDVPVSLKMRLGWDAGRMNAADIARRAEAAGVAMITVHGRTRCQFYKGRADWAAIAPVVRAVAVPVIANGDIVDIASARLALDRSGAAGVMVGRGAQGAPWRLAQIAAELAGTSPPADPTPDRVATIACAHLDAALSFYGRDLGVRVTRKHLGWYMDRGGTEAGMRRRVLTETDPDRLPGLIGAAFDRRQAA